MCAEFKIEDYHKIKVTEELRNELKNYEGVLPFYLEIFIFPVHHEYVNNLMDKGLYEYVDEENKRLREKLRESHDRDKFLEDELMTWLVRNPRFNRILNDSIK